MLYAHALRGAAAQTACSRDLRALRERKLVLRSQLPAGGALELQGRLVRRAALYSLTETHAGSRGRARARDWSWTRQRQMVEANEVFLDLREAAAMQERREWDLPLGGWNAHLHMRLEDQVTRKRVRWQMDGLLAAVSLTDAQRTSRAVCYVHDPDVLDAERLLREQVIPWRSLALDASPLTELVGATQSQPMLLVVSSSAERSRELAQALEQMQLASVPGSAPLGFVDQASIPWAFTEPVVLVAGERERRSLGEIWHQMFGRPWQADMWQLNGDPLQAPATYT
jgi:hypothetical protein